jgi:hypothetical protein
MSAKTEDMEAVIGRLDELVRLAVEESFIDCDNLDMEDVAAILASHAALVEEVAACRNLQNEHANLREASRLQDERIASLEAELRVALSAYAGIIDLGGKLDLLGSNLEMVESAHARVLALLSGKAS